MNTVPPAGRGLAPPPFNGVETLPPALRSAVRTINSSPTPTALFWGRELRAFVNPALVALVGERRAAVLTDGDPKGYGALWDADRQLVAEVYRSGEARNVFARVVELERQGRRERVCLDIACSPVWVDDAVAGVSCTVSDITDRERAEREQNFRLRLEGRLRELKQPLAIAEAVCRAVGEQLGIDRVVYAEEEGDGEFAVVLGGYNAGLPSIAGRHRFADFGAQLFAQLRRGEIVQYDEVATTHELSEAEKQGYRGIGAQAVLDIPLRRAGRLAAVLALHHARPHAFSDEEVALAAEAAERMYGAIERARAEEALADSEERLRLAVDSAEVGFWDVDLVHDRLVWPARTKAMFGISPDAPVTMQDFYDGLHPEDADRTAAAYAAAADPARRALYEVEYRTVGKEDGIVRWVAAKGRGIFDDAGRCLRVAGTAIDITARKAASAELAARTAELEALLNSAPIGICYFDREHRWLRINAELAAINGFPIEAHLGRRMKELLPVNARAVTPVLDHVFATGETLRNVEVTGELPGERGRSRTWLVSYYPVTGADGTVAAVGVWVIDITERISAERRARDSEATLRAVFDSAPVGLVLAEAPSGRVTEGNARFEEIVGHPTILTADMQQYAEYHSRHPDGRPVEPHEYPMAQVISGQAERAELEALYRRPDGDERWVRFVGSAVRDSDGALVGGVVATLDIDRERRLSQQLEREVQKALAERQAAMAQLHEAQKLETIGQLTGGIAHDFNNLLTPIVGSLDIIRRRVSDERSTRLIAGALQSAERAKVLVSRLLSFARRQTLQPRAVDLAVLVEGMRDLIERSLGPNIAVEVAVPAALPAVLADPNQLELALLNLAVNARDAMPKGGRLLIAAQAASEADGPETLRPGRYVRVSVADSGSGMDEGTLARAIEPFFSTKGTGRGTGLGLSMVHGLALQSGGAFTLSSRVGEGTRATLWLPVSDIAAAPEPPREAEAPLAPRAAHVLLVDDEEAARDTTAEALRGLGYRVSEAGDAAAAERLFHANGDIDALVTDQIMPGRTGLELAAALRGYRNDLPVLLITGYANLPPAATGGVVVLPKPFRQAELGARLAALLPEPAMKDATGG